MNNFLNIFCHFIQRKLKKPEKTVILIEFKISFWIDSRIWRKRSRAFWYRSLQGLRFGVQSTLICLPFHRIELMTFGSNDSVVPIKSFAFAMFAVHFCLFLTATSKQSPLPLTTLIVLAEFDSLILFLNQASDWPFLGQTAHRVSVHARCCRCYSEAPRRTS